MHIRKISAAKPAAYNIESILDIVLQVIVVLEELQTFLGIDVANKRPQG
jgi:hypothetical protein